MNKLLFLLPLLVLVLNLHAKDQVAATFSLDDAVQYALQNNPDIKSVSESFSEIDGQITKVRGSMFPDISLQSTATRYRDPSPLNSPSLKSTASVEIEPDNNYDVAIKAVQPIWSGGALMSAYSVAKLTKELFNEKLRYQKVIVTYDLSKAYYDHLQMIKLKEILLGSQEREKNNLVTMKAKRKVGLVQDYEVNRAEVALAKLYPQLIDTDNNIRLTQMRLNQVMGRGIDEELNLTDSIEPKLISIPAFEETLEKALRTRSELLQNSGNKKIQYELNNIEYSKHSPTLMLQGSYGYNAIRKTELFDYDHEKYSIALALKIPIFSGFSLLGAIRESASKNRQMEIQKYKIKDQIYYDVRAALETLKKSEQNLATTKLTSEQADEAMRLVNKNFNRGTASTLDVLTSERDKSQADTDFLRAKYDYKLAIASLKKAVGE